MECATNESPQKNGTFYGSSSFTEIPTLHTVFQIQTVDKSTENWNKKALLSK